MKPQKKSCTLHLQITSANAQRLEVCGLERPLRFELSRFTPIITTLQHQQVTRIVQKGLAKLARIRGRGCPGRGAKICNTATHLPSLFFTASSTTNVNAPAQPPSSSGSARPFLLLILFHQSRFIQVAPCTMPRRPGDLRLGPPSPVSCFSHTTPAHS
jgi:hypothetical protein